MKKALAAACFAALALPAQQARPVRALIVTGQTDLPHHDWIKTTPVLRGILDASGRFEVRVIEEPRGLTAAALSGYDVLVLNYNGPRWGAGAEQAAEDFVREGKGIVSFHQSSYGAFFGLEFNKRWVAGPGPGWEAFPRLLGARWQPGNIGHAPRHVFPVKWTNREHPVSRGLGESFTANDELYHKLDLLPDTQVLATAYDDPANGGTGKEEPVVWTVRFGRGRGFHITLGHDASAMHQAGFVTAFARGTEWAATGAVTLPAALTPLPPRKADAVRVLVVTGGHAYPSSFYTVFEGYDDIVWFHATTQQQAFNGRLSERFDVVVFHDMAEDIGERERAHLKSFVESGKGIVSIHHAIVNYTAWPWWYEEVTGGKYFTKATATHPRSEFKEGVDFVARPAKDALRHPVLRRVGPLPVHDEVYRNMWRSPRIRVLMETDHPLNDRPVVYVGPHPAARSVYIQLGHGEETMRHPGFRQLVRNAILWTGRKLE